MISAVLDTNVLASGTVTTATPPGQILDAWHAGQFELITSAHIIKELTRTFQKPYFRDRLSNKATANFIDLLQNEAFVTPIIVKVQGVATHPEDDLTIATALSAKADYLVTGDKPLINKVGNSYFEQARTTAYSRGGSFRFITEKRRKREPRTMTVGIYQGVTLTTPNDFLKILQQVA